MAWNYLQVEVDGRVLHPTIGAGDMTRREAHARVRALLGRYVEDAPFATDLVAAWDAGARDDTVYVDRFLWAIYEADDPAAGAHDWVEDLARSLRASGPRIRIAW